MDFVAAKTILSKVKYGKQWYGISYNMNLYRGCSHGCIYCDSRSSCYQIDEFDVVKGKKDALLILETELARKKDSGVVGIGSMSDTYNPQEARYELTRGALELLLKYKFGVSIDTKSNLILRDLDLLTQLNQKNSVIVKFTITTPHDSLSKIIEPKVCSSSQRFAAIKKLSEAGIFTGIMLNPILPYITDLEEDIKLLVRLAYENGAKFVHTYMGMTLRDNQRDYYYEQLEKCFSGIREKYVKRYYHDYICSVPNSKLLYQVFVQECKKYGLLYKMSDIIAAYQKESKTDQQLTIFDV